MKSSHEQIVEARRAQSSHGVESHCTIESLSSSTAVNRQSTRAQDDVEESSTVQIYPGIQKTERAEASGHPRVIQ